MRARQAAVGLSLLALLVGLGWGLRAFRLDGRAARVVAPEPAPARPAPPVAGAEAAEAVLAEVTYEPGGDGVVECEVVGDEMPVGASVHEVHPETQELDGIHRVQRVDGSWFRFRPRRASGVGFLKHTRFRDQAFAWDSGTCLKLVELAPVQVTHLHVVVRDVQFEAPVEVVGCDLVSEQPPEGTAPLRVYGDEPKTCTVVARQFVHGTQLTGPPIEVEIAPGSELTVEVEAPRAPELPEGEIGWTISDGGDYVRVDTVIPGSPADRAGLRPGDKVVEASGPLDGELPLELEVEGPEGTRVVELR